MIIYLFVCFLRKNPLQAWETVALQPIYPQYKTPNLLRNQKVLPAHDNVNIGHELATF